MARQTRGLKELLYTMFLFLGSLVVHAQNPHRGIYTHSHNDYLRTQPFFNAYENQFSSIEMDVFLVGDELLVAHDKKDIDPDRTIEKLYLQPLLDQILKNGGKAYAGKAKLQFLIDIKTEAEPALRCLEKKLKPLRHYFDGVNNSNAIRIVISGNMPSPERFHLFDEIFYFDGRSTVNYSSKQLERVPMFSASFEKFSTWKGIGEFNANEYIQVKSFVDSVHCLDKKVRFWGTPDTQTLWKTFITLEVDYINTDSPAELSFFLNNYKK